MRRVWKITALAAGLVLIAEVAIRLLPPLSTATPANFGYPQELWAAESELGHALRPGYAGRFQRHDHHPFEIDTLGRRAIPGCAAPGERPRLVVIGDGIAFGKYERAEDTFAARMQSALPGVDVDCRAVPFYSLPHYDIVVARLLREPVEGAVLLALNPNDLEPFHTHGEVQRALGARGARPGIDLPADDPQRTMERIDPLPFPLRYSALAGEIRKLWWRLDRDANPDRYSPHHRYAKVLLERCDRPESLEIAAHIAYMAQRLRDRGMNLAAVIFPDEFQLSGGNATSPSGRVPAELFKEASEAAGVPFLDLRQPFLEHETPRALVRPNDIVHLSALGHEFVAGLLLEWLRAENVL